MFISSSILFMNSTLKPIELILNNKFELLKSIREKKTIETQFLRTPSSTQFCDTVFL